MSNLQNGEIAPDFSAPAWDPSNQTEIDWKLSAQKGKPVVLLFYPGDFTPVCTMEMCDFRDNLARFQNLKAVIAGISTDDIDKHKKFAEKYQLKFPLISDFDKKIGDLFSVKGPFLGTSHRRAIFIISSDGRLAWHKIEPSAIFRTEAGKIAEVLESL